MKKVYLLLLGILLVLCVAACDDSAPTLTSGGDSSLNNPLETEAKAREILQTWLDDHPFDDIVTIDDALAAEDDSGFIFTLSQSQNGEIAKIRVVKRSGILLHHDSEKNINISISDWYRDYDKYNTKVDSDNSDSTPTSSPAQTLTPTPTTTQTPAPTEPIPSATPAETPLVEIDEAGGEADGLGGEYDDSEYSEAVDDFVTYVNDGFSISVPSDTKISSSVEKEAVNQFSISNGAEVPTEKIYKFEFIWGVADVNVQLNIFPNEGAYFSSTNFTVPNADGAYLFDYTNDSILETSKYELKLLRGDLIYILETTYKPSVALMGQAKGQEDFSYERELLKELLNTFETMINSFALTDNPVSFDAIANSETYWQVNVTDLIR